MSKAQLKKYLQTLPHEQIVQVVLDLYDARKAAKEYLEFYMDPDAAKAVENAKKAVLKVFYTPRDTSGQRSGRKTHPTLWRIFSNSRQIRNIWPTFICFMSRSFSLGYAIGESFVRRPGILSCLFSERRPTIWRPRIIS